MPRVLQQSASRIENETKGSLSFRILIAGAIRGRTFGTARVAKISRYRNRGTQPSKRVPPLLGRFVGDRRGTRGKVQSPKVKLVQICTDCSPNLSRRPVNTDRVSILKYLIAESAMHTWNIYWETGRRRALHDSRPRKDIARPVPLLPRAREIHSKFLPANTAAVFFQERDRETERQTDRQWNV